MNCSSSATVRCNNDLLSCLWSKISQMVCWLSICLSFNSCGTYFPDFFLFSIAFKKSNIFCCATNIVSDKMCHLYAIFFAILSLQTFFFFFDDLPRSLFITSNFYLHIIETIFWMLFLTERDDHFPW